MTLFGLTLAVGLLVDDAIVVVENVERLLHENPGMTPREATIESMREIQVALIAIAMSLSAVFLPMAFFGGSTGVIYKQFSLTIVSAMVLVGAGRADLQPGTDLDPAPPAQAEGERRRAGSTGARRASAASILAQAPVQQRLRALVDPLPWRRSAG